MLSNTNQRSTAVIQPQLHTLRGESKVLTPCCSNALYTKEGKCLNNETLVIILHGGKTQNNLTTSNNSDVDAWKCYVT